ncbi:MAG: rhodanese-like domain-containing protein [Microbacteriaceae bacterium]|jgi:rhodanese-related sulfurtransferase|nr:rhodanese-like domain-containing protein [Microbacteriaceae bacterium]HOA87521.1 rhodanese-like domain-containing protein [Microbacteriaceae bacterium]HPZ34809.1 rhodanese-like domain-containing protein [Microbacteriaceae bacterium]HQC93966.1 rhodanese-like domain-containing protein [Microbacteriaceae bacterium]
MIRSILAAVGALTLALSLAACSTPSSGSAEPAVAVTEETVIVDVRTPAEFAEGHLEGAELLDLTGGDFAAALPSLDPDAEYVVYCRSGNRSGQAVAMMEDAGFTDVTNLGSLGEAADATGLAIVK